MKLTLKREVAVEQWRVIATLGFAQRRPEIIAILALGGELPDGIVTGLDVSRKLLAERPAIVGERLLDVCRMMKLVERVQEPREGWQLTELGRRALKHQEVPSPQRGEFDVWLLADPLHPEVIVRVRPTEPERQPKPGERIEPSDRVPTQESPAVLRRCQGHVVRPPLRLPDEANEVFVFEFSLQGRFLGRESCQLSVELHPGGGTARFDVTFEGRQTSFAPAAKLPALSDALSAAGITEVDKPLEIAFRTLSDGERRVARREMPIEELALPDMGSFFDARLSNVPLVPETQQDANEWAVWRLIDGIRGYVWPQDFEKHVRAVREFAVKEHWSFDPAVPTQKELAQQRLEQPLLARRLLVPLDWQPVEALSAPVLILSGRAALAKHGQKLVKEWADGIARVYVLEPADTKAHDQGVIAELGTRAVARRVQQPADVWLRIGPDGRFGQRWHPAPKQDSKTEKSKPAPATNHDGEWMDLSDDELARIAEELKSAFWKRAAQELQPDGGWIAVKPATH